MIVYFNIDEKYGERELVTTGDYEALSPDGNFEIYSMFRENLILEIISGGAVIVAIGYDSDYDDDQFDNMNEKLSEEQIVEVYNAWGN